MFLFMLREATELRYASYELKRALWSPEVRHFAQYWLATTRLQLKNVPKHIFLPEYTLVLVFSNKEATFYE